MLVTAEVIPPRWWQRPPPSRPSNPVSPISFNPVSCSRVSSHSLTHYQELSAKPAPERSLEPRGTRDELPGVTSLLRSRRAQTLPNAAEVPAHVAKGAGHLSNLQVGVGKCLAFLDCGVGCMEASVRSWNVTVTPALEQFLRSRKRPLPPGMVSISVEQVLSGQWAHLSDSMPTGPSIFGS